VAQVIVCRFHGSLLIAEPRVAQTFVHIDLRIGVAGHRIAGGEVLMNPHQVVDVRLQPIAAGLVL
jgi:hypothetical protein